MKSLNRLNTRNEEYNFYFSKLISAISFGSRV